MKDAEIQKSLRDCESLLKEKEINTRVEELLTKAVLIEICASFNEQIKSILIRKLSIISDESTRDFIFFYIEREFRRLNPKYNDIKGLVARFGNHYKEKFSEKIEEMEEHGIVTNSYDSLLGNRNYAPHSQDIKVTLNQVKDYYEKAHLVLDCLQRTLDVS